MLKYQLIYKSTHSAALNTYITYLKKILKQFNLHFKIIGLPKTRKFWTLLKSPHVFKKSKEQFEVKIYKYVVYVFTPNIHFQRNLLKILYLNKPHVIFLKAISEV